MKKHKPNYFKNRYNQWVIAGKIAMAQHYMGDQPLGTVYSYSDGSPNYSTIGQKFLQDHKINIQDLC